MCGQAYLREEKKRDIARYNGRVGLESAERFNRRESKMNTG